MNKSAMEQKNDDLTVIMRYFSPECSEQDIQQYYIRLMDNPDFQDKSDAYLSLQRIAPLFKVLEDEKTTPMLAEEPAVKVVNMPFAYRKWALVIAATLLPFLVALYFFRDYIRELYNPVSPKVEIPTHNNTFSDPPEKQLTYLQPSDKTEKQTEKENNKSIKPIDSIADIDFFYVKLDSPSTFYIGSNMLTGVAPSSITTKTMDTTQHIILAKAKDYDHPLHNTDKNDTNTQTNDFTLDKVKEKSVGLSRENRLRIMVTRFSVNSRTDQATGQIADEITAIMTNELAKTNCFRVLEGLNNRADINDELGYNETSITDGRDPKLGQLLGAQAIVTAEITEYNEGKSSGGTFGIGIGSNKAKIGIVLKVIDPQTRDIIWSKSVNGEGKKSSFRGASILGIKMAGSAKLSEAMNAAVEDLVLRTVDIMVKEKEAISRNFNVVGEDSPTLQNGDKFSESIKNTIQDQLPDSLVSVETTLKIKSNPLRVNTNNDISFPTQNFDTSHRILSARAKDYYLALHNPENTDNLASSVNVEVNKTDQNIYKALANNDTTTAIKLCVDNLIKKPIERAFDPFIQQGRLLFEDGQYQSAYRLFDICVRHEPDSLMTKQFKAKIYYQMFIFCAADWMLLEQSAYSVFSKIDFNSLPENLREDPERLRQELRAFRLWRKE